ncbi:BAR_ACAPs and ArfGap_ACAP domain-containing protein [Tachysurus vachellii]|uniref:BAR_ACAPs and ArfGap_ACAP domain-containing protein n=1 Tax=Tachysurus vachellii TaxID=175792 RepID=UPI00296AA758|nr:BAR_ACAPs and ArfGap_ACAP domain-containing protein [Tachysurus vachellii]
MDHFLDFEECIRDSPVFRLSLERRENDLEELESRMEKVIRSCNKMVDDGQVFCSSNQLFLSALSDLTTHHKNNTAVENCLQQFNQALQEMIHFHTILLDQTRRAITQQLTNLLTQFLPPLRSARCECVRIRDELNTALVKNAQVPQYKVTEAQRHTHLLLATRKCYTHCSLDYCLQLNNFLTQQKLDTLNSVFSFFHAQNTFFHQGFDLLKDLEPTMKIMAAELSGLSSKCMKRKKNLEHQHLLVQQRDACGEPVLFSGGAIEGYLFKRSRRKNKTWKRCWFSVNHNQLIYTKSHKEQPLVLFDDLRLCAVKSLDSIDRRFCFELLSVQKSCVLQADTEELKMVWMNAVQSHIDMAYRDRVQSEHTQVKDGSLPAPASTPLPGPLNAVLCTHGNHHCCDCGEAEPRWASVNLGITVCIECSGIHRSLGVHLSKVRSLTLDSWDPEQIKLLCVLGNDVINGIYECHLSEMEKPNSDSARQQKEVYIRKKYVERKFVQGCDPHLTEETVQQWAGRRLYDAALCGDIVSMALALAQGGDVNWTNAEGRTPLIGAALGGSLVACEFLLQNGANANHRDQHGHAAIHTATTRGHTGQVCLLLKRGANQYAADEKGKDPLSIAMETAHADIVTLLRMARMNEEMRESEGFFGSVGDDETFQDIVRDFSNMASHDPEQLMRRHFRAQDESQEERTDGKTPETSVRQDE